MTLDAAADVYVANQDTNTVEEIAATTHTQWGQSMTAGDIYLIAGSSSGTSGHTGDGGAATSATLDQPSGVAIDSAGDLYLADAGNNRIQEVPASSGTQWGQSMTANDIYTVAGSSSGTGATPETAGLPPRPPWTTRMAWRSTPPATSTLATPQTTGSKRSLPPLAPIGASR